MGGVYWEFWISKCKLVYREWINYNVLLHGTGYAQYPVINHHGKEYEKRLYVCVYLYLYLYLYICKEIAWHRCRVMLMFY